MSKCDRKGHFFHGKYDEKIVKMHNDFHETVVERIWICDICSVCGKVIKRE